MKKAAISRRYAKALLLIGEEDRRVDDYGAELAGVSALMAQSPLGAAVTNPLYDTASRMRVLKTVTARLSLSPMVASFLLLLLEKGRFGFLADITAYYQKFADDLKGLARASVLSATPLSADAVDRIKEALVKKIGKEILLTVQEDAALIGGIVTRIGDLIFDGSIRTQLSNMRESLKKSEGVEWN